MALLLLNEMVIIFKNQEVGCQVLGFKKNFFINFPT